MKNCAAEKDWDFDTMKAVALRFPDLCAATPMRTHALLTKYTALRSFYTTQTFDLPVYDKTGTYTNILQEAYLDYKSILSTIQVLAYDVAEGTHALERLVSLPSFGGLKRSNHSAVEQAKTTLDNGEGADSEKTVKDSSPPSDGESSDGSLVDVGAVVKAIPKVVSPAPLAFDEPFAPSIVGLEEARLKCRFMMSRIVQEVR
jgi:hypothetical protein